MKELDRAMKSVRASSELLRVPLRGAAPPPTGASRWFARARLECAAALLVVGIVLVPSSVAVRVAAAALVLAGLVVVWARRARSPRVVASAWVVADDRGIARDRDGVTTRLAEWGAQLGFVVLGSEKRDRGVLAVTTLVATRYLPIRVVDAPEDAEAARELFARAGVITDADLRPVLREDEGALSAQDASLLVAAVRARDAGAEGRIVLSDSRGAHVVLEGDALYAGDRVIDLTSPLEWRAFIFVEAGGANAAVASVAQATWVRQAGVEVVFVADADREPSHPRGARVSHPDAPPPIELRMAIERLFMAPLQSALERAPRASRAPKEHLPGEARAGVT